MDSCLCTAHRDSDREVRRGMFLYFPNKCQLTICVQSIILTHLHDNVLRATIPILHKLDCLFPVSATGTANEKRTELCSMVEHTKILRTQAKFFVQSKQNIMDTHILPVCVCVFM